MKFAFFYHSLVSDWNHGNAHFLRGIVSELKAQGHEVRIFEPWNSWSRVNLIVEQGESSLIDFSRAYPRLKSFLYDPKTIDLDEALDDINVVIVHEWNDPLIVQRIGKYRSASRSFALYFHDTHHRSVTDERSIEQYDLSNYDGVLAYGEVIKDRYLRKGWAKNAWTWHEAADISVFRPLPGEENEGDLVWVGNWGDDERTSELTEFLLNPVAELRIRACAYGVRYPDHALSALDSSGIRYCGWIANHRVPQAFARYKVTVHIPRRPYVESLPGIPTIRPFEALACGIPLICSPWDDTENLFEPGKDFLAARTGTEMKKMIHEVLNNRELASSLSEHGLKTILSKHTCAHRVKELFQICSKLKIFQEKVVPA